MLGIIQRVRRGGAHDTFVTLGDTSCCHFLLHAKSASAGTAKQRLRLIHFAK